MWPQLRKLDATMILMSDSIGKLSHCFGPMLLLVLLFIFIQASTAAFYLMRAILEGTNFIKVGCKLDSSGDH